MKENKKIIVKCDTCGVLFEKYKSKLGKHNFCCRDCYSKFHSKNVPICICQKCGKSFRGAKYNINKYCSRECYLEDHKIQNKNRQCPVCNKIFTAKSSEDKYCSWNCYNQDRHPPKGENHWNWQGGISKENDHRDSSKYKNWRLSIFKRDNYTCQKCGSKEKINAHHLYSWKEYPEKRYDLENGITLCEKCHIKVHQKYGYDTKEKMDI